MKGAKQIEIRNGFKEGALPSSASFLELPTVRGGNW